MARKPRFWKKCQGRRAPEQLVFIDETRARTNMTRTCGWSPCGEKLLAKVAQGHWKTLAFLAALRSDRIDAPLVLEGPINGTSFAAYPKQCLVPTLWPGNIVIIDNLGSHKSPAIRKALREAGARLLFLPPYSPDLKPIEAGLRQTQNAAPQGRRTHPRGNLERHRNTAYSLQARRIHKLSQKLRICVKLGERDSRCVTAARRHGYRPLMNKNPGGSRGFQRSHRSRCSLSVQNDLHTAILRLAHVWPCWNQKMSFAVAFYHDILRRNPI